MPSRSSPVRTWSAGIPRRTTDRRGHHGVVAGDDLHAKAELGEAPHRGGGRRLRRITEHEEPVQGEPVLVRCAQLLEIPGVAARNRDHAHTAFELCLQQVPGRVGHAVAEAEHRLGCAFRDQRSDTAVLHQGGRPAPLVVERDEVEHTDVPVGSALGVAQRFVQRTAAASRAGHRRIGAAQPELGHTIGVGAARVDRPFEGDPPLGQRARLVGEQDVDVAEVLDAHQPLHEDLVCGQPVRAGREARRHDRRQQLRRDPHRDREREEHRVDQRTAQGDVDHEDRQAQDAGDLREEPGELRQTDLELRRRLALPEAERDRAEPRRRRRSRRRPPAPNHGARRSP